MFVYSVKYKESKLEAYTYFAKALEKLGVEYSVAEPLKFYTTVGIGGSADLFVKPTSVLQLISTVELAKAYGVPYFVLGGGSNVLVSRNGFRGAVISSKGLGEIYIEGIDCDGVLVRAFAGVSLPVVSEFCRLNALGGAEFLCCIPGTVGGGVKMNAGCLGEELSGLIRSVTFLRGGQVQTYSSASCAFEYRQSGFTDGDVIISVLFRTKTASIESVTQKIRQNRERRASQPSGKNMGSVFKNGTFSAGKLIDSCGLKGFRIGGAYVSPKHANFIINDGTASSTDVAELIKTVKAVVKERTGVALTEEIKYVGEFS